MSESPKEKNSSQNRNKSNKAQASENEEDQINQEEEISEDKFQLQQYENSSVLLSKLIQLFQELLLDPVNKYNKDIFLKYDKDKLFDKESLDYIDLEINNFKMSFIDEQYKIIKELITKYDLMNSMKDISEEKIFSKELNSYNINIELLPFFGPFSSKIKEINEKGGSDDPLEIEKFMFKLLEISYYQNKTTMLLNNIKILDEQIEDLKNKNKL